MKIKFLSLLILPTILLPLSVKCQTENIIKPDSLNLCVFKVDYMTYKFEGGKMLYYAKCPATDSLPFTVTRMGGGDFDKISFSINNTSETVFNASIIWMGTGEIAYPKNFSMKSPFNFINKKIKKPTAVEYFGMQGEKIKNDLSFIQKADSAWRVVSSLNISNMFSKIGLKVGIFLYPPTIGTFNPYQAKWIIFLCLCDNDPKHEK